MRDRVQSGVGVRWGAKPILSNWRLVLLGSRKSYWKTVLAIAMGTTMCILLDGAWVASGEIGTLGYAVTRSQHPILFWTCVAVLTGGAAFGAMVMAGGLLGLNREMRQYQLRSTVEGDLRQESRWVGLRRRGQMIRRRRGEVGLAPGVRDSMLNLRVGEWVEVRTPQEILATLDKEGSLEGLPFMPEMLTHCGKRFRVFKRADRTCDTIEWTGMRRMHNAVHLEGRRCDGRYHGGCQAGCLIFWKEAWLRRVDDYTGAGAYAEGDPVCAVETVPPLDTTDTDVLGKLVKWTRGDNGSGDVGSEIFSCQATQLRRATHELPDPEWRQFLRDLVSGTLSITQVAKVLVIRLFNWVQFYRRGIRYPCLGVGSGFVGKLTKTPKMVLNLAPGECVQVKTTDEIRETLDQNNKNRGLSFDVEMVKYCGGRFRVQRRVEQIIDERTGKMMRLPNDCIILDNVMCTGEFHQLCSRSIYTYWREIWLRRDEDRSVQRTPEHEAS